MWNVVWTAEAAENLESIITYIEAFNPLAAERMGQRLVALAGSLAEFPDRGRIGPEGTREMTIVPPYIVRYRVNHGNVAILRIWHGARDLD